VRDTGEVVVSLLTNPVVYMASTACGASFTLPDTAPIASVDTATALSNDT